MSTNGQIDTSDDWIFRNVSRTGHKHIRNRCPLLCPSGESKWSSEVSRDWFINSTLWETDIERWIRGRQEDQLQVSVSRLCDLSFPIVKQRRLQCSSLAQMKALQYNTIQRNVENALSSSPLSTSESPLSTGQGTFCPATYRPRTYIAQSCE